MKYATREILVLSPLPCWKHLSEEVRRQLIVEMIADVEAEEALRRQRSGSQVLGASAVRGQHPFDRPARPKRSPAPLFHAVSKQVRQALGGLRMVRRSVSPSVGEAAIRKPVGAVPSRELSACPAFRGRIGVLPDIRRSLACFAPRRGVFASPKTSGTSVNLLITIVYRSGLHAQLWATLPKRSLRQLLPAAEKIKREDPFGARSRK